MTDAKPGFQFLVTEGAQPFLPSGFFIVADPKVRERNAWTLELDAPKNAAWVYRLDDIKSWMLHGKESERKIFFDPADPRTPFRVLERSEVFREYVRKLLERLPATHRDGRKLALMPAVADEKIRKRYKEALEAAIPGVTVVPEPEMVAEYFRLLQRTLELEKGENNVILVVDVGASTANMTVIVSRRDETILDIDAKGAQRDLRVRALRGDSVRYAGRWVDLELTKSLAVPEVLLDKDPNLVHRAVEDAKLRCSKTGKRAVVSLPSGGKPLALDPPMLEAQSKALWRQIVPLFEGLCERLYENQTSSEDARRKSEARFVARGVKGPKDAPRLIDVILLAGGTSLLPGFERAMMTALFPADHRPQVFRVGDAFPVAAAAGGLAHILRTYDPPRLRPGDVKQDETFEAPFDGSLPYPLMLGVKRSSDKELQTVVLDPDDPFVDDGGRRPIIGVPPLSVGSQPRMRLIPGGDAGVLARKGRHFQSLRVREAPGAMELEWDPVKQRAAIRSNQVENTAGTLWIDAQLLRQRKEDPQDVFTGAVPAGSLVVDGADDVVLDLGMSKVVAMGATPGWVTSGWLEQTVQRGLGDEGVDRSSFATENARVAVSGRRPPATQPQVIERETNEPSRPDHASTVGPKHLPGKTPDRTEAPTGPIISPVAEPETPRSPEARAIPNTEAPALGESSQVGVAETPANELGLQTRVGDQEFTHALEALREALEKSEIKIPIDDLTVAVLALAVRPFVLLAGPPGCGKSTLVRVVAHLLGTTPGETFHEVAVQAHWENDEPLFGKEGLLRCLFSENAHSHLVLFDEVNLTRPEYFLSRFFFAIEDGKGHISPKVRIAPCRAFGTLNIDDTSRPPSPKVIDRCFLLELGQVPWKDGGGAHVGDIAALPQFPGLPDVSVSGADSDERIEMVLNALSQAVDDHNLRHDLLPSRRVLIDTRALLGLHHRLDLEARRLLRRGDLVDRLLSGRILVKLTGAFEQLQPALDAVERAVDGMEELGRTKRRIRLARQQSRLGFVSPWQ
jgi:energy-coupling factor transporter ATP-binding protein EcfA2